MRRMVVYGLLFAFLFSYGQNDGKHCLSEGEVALATPILQSDGLFFTDTAQVRMLFSLPGAEIRYTLDGSLPTAESSIYKKPLSLTASTNITAMATHPQYQNSAPVTLKVIKTNTKLWNAEVTVRPLPHTKYQGKGTSALLDHQKGTLAFASGDQWLGFNVERIVFELKLSRSTPISKVILSSLRNPGAWIFAPRMVTVYAHGASVGELRFPEGEESDEAALEFVEIPINKASYAHLRIAVEMAPIPEWHQGKGTLPWFFVDEILVE